MDKEPEFTIHVDMNKRCTWCKRKGATQIGLCLSCVTKIIKTKIKQERKVKQT